MSSGDKNDDDDGSVGSYDSFSDDDDFEYRNKRIAKSFYDEGDIFFGTIIKFKPPDLWHILYDDDDEQDMDEDDLRRAFRLYERKKYRDPQKKLSPPKDEDGEEKAAAPPAAKSTKNSSKKKDTSVADFAKALAAEVDAKAEEEEEDETKQTETEEEAKPKTTEQSLCDVCRYRDGHSGLEMLRCIKCQLTVHKDCYGLQTYTQNEFICWACESVGKEIPVSMHGCYDDETKKEETTKGKEMDASSEPPKEPPSSGKKEVEEQKDDVKIVQKFRPTHCALCNHNPRKYTAVHAMHPIYDNHGPRGRQKAVKDKDGNMQLAWGHTLCAFMLSEHNVLYGVQANGTTHEGAEEDPRDNERSINPFLKNEDEIIEDDCDYGDAAPLHHFVYFTHVGKNKRRDTTMALKKVRDFQANKCFICDKSTVTGLEIPIQCLANDTHEYKNFKGTHVETLKSDECCTAPLHVGCGRWGINNHPTPAGRVFLFPGGEGDGKKAEPCKGIYCNTHACDVTLKGRIARDEREKKAQEAKREQRKKRMEKYRESGTVTEEENPKEEEFKQLKKKKKNS